MSSPRVATTVMGSSKTQCPTEAEVDQKRQSDASPMTTTHSEPVATIVMAGEMLTPSKQAADDAAKSVNISCGV